MEGNVLRIAIGQVIHETNTFSNERTTEEMFRQWEWNEKEEIFQAHEGVKDYLGGMIDEGRKLGAELIPTISVAAQPSGIITAETWLKIKERMLEHLKALDDVDAVCLALHGAGVSETSDDIEGELLSDIRTVIGRHIPIVATLDLHANMTDTMVRNANVLLGVNHYPHIDEYDRGKEVIRLLYELVNRRIAPRMHLTKLPLLVPTSTTFFGPAHLVNDVCRAWEEKVDILDCTFFHGFPYSDIPQVGASVLVIANGDKSLAQRVSEEVAKEIWELRDEFHVSHLSPRDGLELALQQDQGPILINETSDNPGAGAPGDGTFLLAEMIRKNTSKTCFCHISDPEVVDIAHNAGVGTTINISLGGKTDRRHGSPLEVEAYVKCLTDGIFIQTSPMEKGKKVCLGKSTRLVVGNVDVIVCSMKSQLLDDELLKLHGIDLEDYKIIGIKSSQHFRGFFEHKVAKIITVDGPGISTFNFSQFDFKKISKPIYPLDNVVLDLGI